MPLKTISGTISQEYSGMLRCIEKTNKYIINFSRKETGAESFTTNRFEVKQFDSQKNKKGN
ncbi:MAG TPA: hypothetical protein VE076_07130 [Nitrososphaeraceae archaeon]|nr:hypothetical protein [Nitrososphaeraceae archaeon]